ncbi:MAG: hypothetical protein JNL73_03395 [Anaerolineales bacterium]|nr:hypothetical protein [Anaerolineales bacterium]
MTQKEPTVNPETIQRVRQSWAQVTPIASQAAELFYANLFAADPTLRPLFRSDLTAQGHKLIQMLDAAVNGLDDLEALVPPLQALARRHSGYGVLPAHYATVGAALLLTLEQGLGPAFTQPVRAAWTEVYGRVADVMIAAGQPSAA